MTAPATLDIRALVGRFSIAAAEHVGRVANLAYQMLLALAEWRVWVPRAFEQAENIGYGSVFIVALTAGFAGAVASLQAGYQFT